MPNKTIKPSKTSGTGRGAPGKPRAAGAGPKPKGQRPLSRRVSLRLAEETDDSLTAHAETRGVDRTDIAREAIEEWLRNHQFV